MPSKAGQGGRPLAPGASEEVIADLHLRAHVRHVALDAPPPELSPVDRAVPHGLLAAHASRHRLEAAAVARVVEERRREADALPVGEDAVQGSLVAAVGGHLEHVTWQQHSSRTHAEEPSSLIQIR